MERAIGKGLPIAAVPAQGRGAGRAGSPRSPRGFRPARRRPTCALGDARTLRHVALGAVDVIVTSPPYLGTYDYAEQHARRFGWLGLDARRFAARRSAPAAARARRRARSPTWQGDVDAFVAEFARVLRPGGRAFVAIGDSALGAQVVPGDQALRRAAARARLTVPASASQARENFYRPAARLTRRVLANPHG